MDDDIGPAQDLVTGADVLEIGQPRLSVRSPVVDDVDVQDVVTAPAGRARPTVPPCRSHPSPRLAS